MQRITSQNQHIMKRLKKHQILPMIILLAFTACNSAQKSNDKVLDRLYQFKGFSISEDTRAVVIIADNTCIPCNKALAGMMTDYLKDTSIKFVISAHESGMDLSDYLESGRKDIVFDRAHQLTDHEIVKGSTVLLLQNKQVDTVIQIQADKIPDQLQYLRQRL